MNSSGGEHYDNLWAQGYSDDDIENLPTNALMDAMIQWLQSDQNQ